MACSASFSIFHEQPADCTSCLSLETTSERAETGHAGDPRQQLQKDTRVVNDVLAVQWRFWWVINLTRDNWLAFPTILLNRMNDFKLYESSESDDSGIRNLTGLSSADFGRDPEILRMLPHISSWSRWNVFSTAHISSQAIVNFSYQDISAFRSWIIPQNLAKTKYRERNSFSWFSFFISNLRIARKYGAFRTPATIMSSEPLTLRGSIHMMINIKPLPDTLHARS